MFKKLFLIPLLLLIFPKIALASEIVLSGTIVDSNNRPVPNAKLTFTNIADNKDITVVADKSGIYQTNIADGKYTIVVSGGEGSDLPQTTFRNQAIAASSSRDFVLSTGPQSQVEPFFGTNNQYMIFGFIVFVTLAVIIFLIFRRRR